MIAKMDTYVNQADAGRNYGQQPKLIVNGGANERRTYLYFPVTIGSTVTSAILKLYLKGTWTGGAHTISVKRLSSKFVDTQVTWNSKPTSTGSSITSAVTNGVDGQEVSIDITSIISNGGAWYGLQVTVDTSGDKMFYASEYTDAAKAPQIEISQSLTPDAPENLRPAGGGAISAAQPILTWDFSTKEAQEQAKSRVQIHTTTDFSTPAYDSTLTANTENQWDMTGEALSMSDNTTYYWRVMIQDSSGLDSDWSTTAELIRRSHGTLTITSPAADNNNVEVTTPNITHTFTGRTQTYTEYILEEKLTGDTVWKEVYHRPYTADTALSFTIPENKITHIEADADYRLTLRVTDSTGRVAIPGETTYVEKQRTFQFGSTAGTTAPAAFTATEDGAGIVFGWTRGSAPDYFLVRDEDVDISGLLDPVDVLVSGTNYSWTYYGGVPDGTSHTYSVEAIATSKTSISNPTTTFTYQPVGLWLVAPEQELSVVFLSKPSIETALGQVAETYYPLNRRDPVRVVGNTRGFEGSAGGVILEYDGTTAADYLDYLYQIAELSPTTSLRLIWKNRNIPVTIGDLSISQSTYPEEGYDVKFNFWQNDEWSVDA